MCFHILCMNRWGEINKGIIWKMCTGSRKANKEWYKNHRMMSHYGWRYLNVYNTWLLLSAPVLREKCDHCPLSERRKEAKNMNTLTLLIYCLPISRHLILMGNKSEGILQWKPYRLGGSWWRRWRELVWSRGAVENIQQNTRYVSWFETSWMVSRI